MDGGCKLSVSHRPRSPGPLTPSSAPQHGAGNKTSLGAQHSVNISASLQATFRQKSRGPGRKAKLSKSVAFDLLCKRKKMAEASPQTSTGAQRSSSTGPHPLRSGPESRHLATDRVWAWQPAEAAELPAGSIVPCHWATPSPGGGCFHPQADAEAPCPEAGKPAEDQPKDRADFHPRRALQIKASKFYGRAAARGRPAASTLQLP